MINIWITRYKIDIWITRYKIDGLNSLSYSVLSREDRSTYTLLSVELHKVGLNIFVNILNIGDVNIVNIVNT